MAGDERTITIDHGTLRLAGIGFGLWSLILPVTAWFFIAELRDIRGTVAPGILPVAVERVEFNNHRIEALLNRIESLEQRERK